MDSAGLKTRAYAAEDALTALGIEAEVWTAKGDQVQVSIGALEALIRLAAAKED